MKAELHQTYAVLRREPGDSRIAHESTTAYRLKLLLNAQGHHFTRMNPSRYGLTDCRVGLWDRKAGVMLWHERYQVEDAARAFNEGKVTFQRVNV